MNKKQNHTNSQKRDLFFGFFWTILKRREQQGLQSFLCFSTYPAIHSSWKTKPLHDPLWSRTPPESGRGLTKNWKPVFSSSFAFCLFLKTSRSVLTDSQILSARQHRGDRTEAEEPPLGYSRGTYDASRPWCGGAEQTWSHQPGQICLFRIH